MRYWLFKTEPSAFSYDDLVHHGRAQWEGVRNFQARNFLRDDVKVGDRVLFYHSSVDPKCVVGTAVVVKGGYPDDSAWDPKSAHPDPKSTPGNPVWYMVDVRPESRFKQEVTLEAMKVNPRLAKMRVIQRGARLSIQPVTKDEFEEVCRMGGLGKG